MTCAEIIATPSRTLRERKNNQTINENILATPCRMQRDRKDNNMNTDIVNCANVALHAHSCSQLESEENSEKRKSFASPPNLSPFICPSVRRLVNNARTARLSLSPDLLRKMVDNRRSHPTVGGNVGGGGGSAPCLHKELGEQDRNSFEGRPGVNVSRESTNSLSGSAFRRVPPPLLIPKPSPVRLPLPQSYESAISKDDVATKDVVHSFPSLLPLSSSSSLAQPANRYVSKESNPSFVDISIGRSLRIETGLPSDNSAAVLALSCVVASASDDLPIANPAVNFANATSSGIPLTSVTVSSPISNPHPRPSVTYSTPLESVAFVCPTSQNIRTQPLPIPGSATGAVAGGLPLDLDVRRGLSAHAMAGSNYCLSYCSFLFALPRLIGCLWGKDSNANGIRKETSWTGYSENPSNTVMDSVGRAASQNERPCKFDLSCPCVPRTTRTVVPEQEVSSPFLCWWGILLLFLICFVGPFVYLSLLQSI